MDVDECDKHDWHLDFCVLQDLCGKGGKVGSGGLADAGATSRGAGVADGKVDGLCDAVDDVVCNRN